MLGRADLNLALVEIAFGHNPPYFFTFRRLNIHKSALFNHVGKGGLYPVTIFRQTWVRIYQHRLVVVG